MKVEKRDDRYDSNKINNIIKKQITEIESDELERLTLEKNESSEETNGHQEYTTRRLSQTEHKLRRYISYIIKQSKQLPRLSKMKI